MRPGHLPRAVGGATASWSGDCPPRKRASWAARSGHLVLTIHSGLSGVGPSWSSTAAPAHSRSVRPRSPRAGRTDPQRPVRSKLMVTAGRHHGDRPRRRVGRDHRGGDDGWLTADSRSSPRFSWPAVSSSPSGPLLSRHHGRRPADGLPVCGRRTAHGEIRVWRLGGPGAPAPADGRQRCRTSPSVSPTDAGRTRTRTVRTGPIRIGQSNVDNNARDMDPRRGGQRSGKR